MAGHLINLVQSWSWAILPTILLASFIVLVLRRTISEIPSKLNFPVVEVPSKDTRDAILQGYKKYPDTPFVLPVNPPRVVLPMSMFKEVVEIPEEDMSFRELVHFMFNGQNTHLGESVDELVTAIRIDLTKSIGALMPILQDECRLAFATVMKDVGKEWKTVPAQPSALQIVSRLSGRVFVGPELCRQPEYLGISSMFTSDAAKVRNDLQQYNQILRPWVTPFLDSLSKVRQHLRDAKKWMDPIVDELLPKNGEKAKVVSAGSRGAWISWLLKYLPDHLKTAKKLGLMQMQVSFASLHTTTGASTNALIDLATHPQFVAGLREEIDAVLAEDGEALDEEGQLYITKAAIAKMRKLDSFLKESQRLTPLAFDGLSRRLHKDVTFSNGIKVPKGVLLTLPMYPSHQSVKNPIIGPQPPSETAPLDVFDGYRFARLRERPGNESKFQSTATGEGQFTFGHGPNACPGRFFALYIMKVIMIHVLRNYDIRLPPEVQAAGRPRGITAGVSNLLDSKVEIQLRQRADIKQ
ncbi:cytochrome P450 [Xylaria palmicola]|nr:cytochrome P450 [Xylaria palmicola]